MRVEERMVGPSGKDRAAVVIPVKDIGDDITRRCVEHLSAKSELPLRVILVESSGPEFSFGRSINAGIRAAEGHGVVICMDSDAYPETGALSELLSCMRNDQRLGYAAAVAKAPDFHPNIGWAHMSLPWFVLGCIRNRAPMFMLRRLRIGGWWTFGVRAPKEYLPGRMVGASTTTFAIRRACFDEVGPMDERFKVSFSDQDLCFRIMLSDRWYLTSCPKARVAHEEHKTRKAPKEEKEFADWRLFLEKWPRERVRALLAAAHKGKFVVPSGK